MGKHAKPIELHRLSGADRKHPERYSKEVPKSELPLGAYPETRNTHPQNCWHEIETYAIPGVLTGADRFMLEIAADGLAAYRQVGFAEFPGVKLSQLISLLARFGLSPSDRTKLGVPKDKNDNPFAHLDD